MYKEVNTGIALERSVGKQLGLKLVLLGETRPLILRRLQIANTVRIGFLTVKRM